MRWRGNYAYIDAVTADGEVWQLCRLRRTGQHDHWEFAIYLAGRDGYEPNILPIGWPTGTPKTPRTAPDLSTSTTGPKPPKA